MIESSQTFFIVLFLAIEEYMQSYLQINISYQWRFKTAPLRGDCLKSLLVSDHKNLKCAILNLRWFKFSLVQTTKLIIKNSYYYL